MMKLSSVLAVAATLVSVECFAPGRAPDHHHPVSQKQTTPSELRYSSMVESQPEIKLPTRNKRRTVSLVQQGDVIKIERPYKPLASTKKPKAVASVAQRRRRAHHHRKRPQGSTSHPSVSELIASQKQTIKTTQLQQRKGSTSTAAKRPGLTRQEETEYSFRIRTFRAAVRLRDQLVREQNGMYIHPTEAQWAKACGTSIMDLRRVMHEGQNARSALVNANVGLVTSIAKKNYHGLKAATQVAGGVGTILTLQDMIQEGNLGLMEAAERYEPERGFRFSTYATWWVRQRILRSISDSSRTIRLPAHVHSMLKKLKKAKADIKSELGREPTSPELANHMDVKEEKLQLYQDLSRNGNVLSLEKPLRTSSFRDDTRTLGDTLASDAPTPEEDAEADYLRRDIRALMDTALAEKEREVILKRFGLEDGKPRTVRETAELLDLTNDRVRLVEARALNKLRHPQRKYKLREYVSGESSNDLHKVRNDSRRSQSRTQPRAGSVFNPESQNESQTGTPRSDRIWFF